MKALITGGAGFIGSHLAEALVARGDEVYIIDDLSTGRVENLRELLDDARVHVRWHSILDETVLQELVDEVDVVFHLAAAVGVRLILDKPVETIETNILGTGRVLQCAAKGRKKVVLASSSEVYGKNDRVPLGEDDDGLLGPTVKSRWSYACSKAIDEFLALAYWREKAVPVVIARFFNTIGPRQTGRYGMVVPRFVQQALRGEPITVYGDGQQSRSFTAVDDAVAAAIQLAGQPEAVGHVFNVGNGTEVSILELARRVKALVDSSSPIRFVPYDQAYQEGFEDLRRRVPDISKLRRFTGFEPRWDLDAILARVIEYHRTRPSD
ncbi:MAG: GDP-mannose 4,6-dehydratase [Candidatus Rokubacteria bacterium]|nr:GDP-mannose 4,6-dehydratase [Candidatus Rokubacteria bacterium]